MSGIAPSELFLIVVIGLIILGPKRLPQVANQLGSWLGQARRMTRMMKRQLEDEINLDINSINKPFDIEKGLGLSDDKTVKGSESTEPKADPDVSRPEYVHDRKYSDAESDAATKPELPDDYSPDHGPEDIGTGVGDDDRYADAAAEDSEAAVAAADAEQPGAETGGAEPKKETA